MVTERPGFNVCFYLMSNAIEATVILFAGPSTTIDYNTMMLSPMVSFAI